MTGSEPGTQATGAHFGAALFYYSHSATGFAPLGSGLSGLFLAARRGKKTESRGGFLLFYKAWRRQNREGLLYLGFRWGSVSLFWFTQNKNKNNAGTKTALARVFLACAIVPSPSTKIGILWLPFFLSSWPLQHLFRIGIGIGVWRPSFLHLAEHHQVGITGLFLGSIGSAARRCYSLGLVLLFYSFLGCLFWNHCVGARKGPTLCWWYGVDFYCCLFSPFFLLFSGLNSLFLFPFLYWFFSFFLFLIP